MSEVLSMLDTPKTSDENRAQTELDALLAKQDNRFLTEIPKHKRNLDESGSAIDALAYAWKMIDARLQRTFHQEYSRTLDCVAPEQVNYRGMYLSINSILQHAREIGRGADAFVVIDKNEIRNIPPEVCYKFALNEATPRGRNDTFEEMRIHDLFYKVATSIESKIGVPAPFYAVEIAGKKMIAMEKLGAENINDILRYKGHLPEWIDIDELCYELTNAINAFHAAGLFHRDMHFGNIMISQATNKKATDKIAYIIDFGLSTHASEAMQPYRKEMVGLTFTYNDDYAIISQVRNALVDLRKRRKI